MRDVSMLFSILFSAHEINKIVCIILYYYLVSLNFRFYSFGKQKHVVNVCAWDVTHVQMYLSSCYLRRDLCLQKCRKNVIYAVNEVEIGCKFVILVRKIRRKLWRSKLAPNNVVISAFRILFTQINLFENPALGPSTNNLLNEKHELPSMNWRRISKEIWFTLISPSIFDIKSKGARISILINVRKKTTTTRVIGFFFV